MIILLYVLITLVLAVAVILLVASRRPDHFETSRSLRIAAPPEKLFGLIENLREMNRWNPYALRETGGKADYSGPASGKVEFIIRDAIGGSDVTWAMSGAQPLFGKVFGLFVDCDKMVGKDFDEGLANLKAIAEAP